MRISTQIIWLEVLAFILTVILTIVALLGVYLMIRAALNTSVLLFIFGLFVTIISGRPAYDLSRDALKRIRKKQ